MNAHSQPEIVTRQAPLAVSSWNADERTLEATFSTGARVERYDAQGAYLEELDLNQDWSSFVGRPLLNSHRRGDVSDVLGSVAKAWTTVGGNREARAVLKLSRRADIEPILQDIFDGHLRGVSIGYTVQEWRTTKDVSTGRRVKIASKWTPLELSLVAVPADASATLRGTTMTVENQPAAQPAVPPAVSPGIVNPPSATSPEIVDRSAHNTEIRGLARSLGLSQAWIDTQIDSAPSIEAVRAAALDEMVRRSSSPALATYVVADNSDPVAIRTAMAGALAARIAPAYCKIESRSQQFASHSILDMAGDLATSRGDRFNIRDRDALLQRAVGAHSTSDFPLLLSDAANKALLAQYQVAGPTYRKWATRKSFADFKEHQFLRVGDMPAFQEIREDGEVRYGSISESAEKISAKEYVTGITIGRRALINDDMSALSDFSTAIATRAAADENRLAYGVLKANGTLSDGVALFHASHGNLPTAVAFGADGIAAAVKALRAQKSLDGLQLNLQPALLVVGPDLEVAARQLLAAVNATKSGDVNVWANFAELIVDGNLGATEYYIFASPSAVPVAAYGYIQGAEGPVIRSERDFDTQAVKVAASLDFGVGIIDYRGAVKNAGA